MKSILISLLVIIGAQHSAQANSEIEKLPVSTPPVYANLKLESVSRNMTTINPFFKTVASANVTFNNKKLTLTLNRRMPNCPPGMMCAQVMPAPLIINLVVSKIENTQCSVKITASTPSNVKSMIYETVIVEDFTASKCPRALSVPVNQGYVTYSVTGISSLTKQQETATAQLSVDEFIRAQF